MPAKRKLDDAGTPAKKKRVTSFQERWTSEFPCILKSKEGPQYAFCKICNTSIRIACGGKSDVQAHVNTSRHNEFASEKKENHSLSHFGFSAPKSNSLEKGIIRAETLFTVFVAEHNLPFSVADHFTKLCKQMFTDSDIAVKFASGRTKTTQILKQAIAPSCDKIVEKLCQENPFSILVDESNDRGNDKNLVILVRVFDDSVGNAVTKFLDMPICNRATGENLFNAIDNVFQNRGLKWENVVGYCSDNASVMIGRHNSVLSRIREHQPAVFNLGCICHLANLCAGHAVKQLPIPVNDILVDIYYHFKHSSLRLENLKDFQEFTDTDEEKILKHATTRWLSLEKCVKRTLSQWPALYSYFNSHDDVEKAGKVKLIAGHLASVESKLYFCFLEYILAPLNEFNIMFQTDTVKIASLDQEMRRLLRKFLGKFVQVKTIKEHSLTEVPYKSEECQLPNNLLAVGMTTRTLISEKCVDQYIQDKFFMHVRKFYCAVVDKMLMKFPFDNAVLQNMLWILPDESSRDGASFESVSKIAQHLMPRIDTDTLQEEFIDYQLAENLPKPTEAKDVDVYWYNVGKMTDFTGKPRFPQLASLAKTVLSIPHSNADSERVFSIVKKIHTETRDSLDNSTIVSLLSTKINMSGNCFQVELDDRVLKEAKQATMLYNKEHC